MSERIRVVAAAIVRGGHVLVAQRAASMALPGCWELPGGKVESGEDDRAALARELLEELSADVAVGDLIGVSDWDGGRRPIRLVAYRCTLRGGGLTLHEHQAIDWVAGDRLDDVDWAPADRPFVAPLRRLLTGDA